MSASAAPSRPLLGFLLRFLAISIPLFLAWELFLRDPYVGAIAQLFAASARLLGRDVQVLGVQGGDLHLAYAGSSWTDKFGITGIDIVALVALLLATGPVRWPRRLSLLGLGVTALIVTQVLGLWSDIVHVHLHTNPAGLRFADGLRNFMLGFGTFLFPLLIWLILARDLPPLRRAPLLETERGPASPPPIPRVRL